MKEFDPRTESVYRATTERHAKTAGITLNRRICHKCKQVSTVSDGKIIRGTSRHNPSRFYCFHCKEHILKS